MLSESDIVCYYGTSYVFFLAAPVESRMLPQTTAAAAAAVAPATSRRYRRCALITLITASIEIGLFAVVNNDRSKTLNDS